jgi:hypothetical protein
MRASHIKYYIITAIVALAIASCTKVIDLKLGNNTGQLVIEGNVSNEDGLGVKLSRNVPFSSTNTYPPVTGATVIITDDFGDNLQLSETQPGTYTIANTPELRGVSGRTYTLSVQTGGQIYSAVSTLPHQVRMDSITASNSQFSSTDKQKGITVYFQDPANQVNQYRFIMTVNGVQVKNIFAYNDDFTNGRYVSIELLENDIDVYSGDTVKVEMQCIDQNMYKYWFTLSQQEGNNPGGAVAPSNPPTNITPATLGYFSAHTTQSLTLVVR